MEFYTLRELHLPHPNVANGVIIGYRGSRFIVIFIDDSGEMVGQFIYQSSEPNPWHDFTQQYIDICRRLAQKPWKPARNIDTLFRYLCDVM